MKWWYKIRYKPCRVLWSSGVYIYYSTHITKIKVGKEWLFVPFSYFRPNNQESFNLLSSYIREAKFKRKYGSTHSS